MPAAFENYGAYAQDQVQRVQSVSPASTCSGSSGVQESLFTYNYDSRTMSTAGSYSPSSMESPLMETCDTLSTANVFDIIGPNAEISICEKTEIKIVVQPVDKFRFRYRSEMMGTHGSLLGEREEPSHKKEVPTVQLINCPFKNAVIRCTLVTADEERRFPHAHHLVRKEGNEDRDDPHDIEVSDESNYTAMFCNMGIIHTAKKNIKEEILRKRKIEIIDQKRRTDFVNAFISTREELEMKLEAEKAQKWMNLNSVALCFQGFCYGENNVLYPLTDKIYSRPINNLKSALTGELKICRIDKHTSSCEGNEEVWLLVEKVGRKNIKVKFFEVDIRDNVIWEAEGRFSELDVHHQYAIVFKTPPYKDVNITEPKEVYLKLERPSDGENSNTMKFIYKPTDKVLQRKRPRMSSSSSTEFARQNTSSNPRLENCMLMSETYMNLDVIDISAELKKIITETCNPEEYEAFMEGSDLEKLIPLYSHPSDTPGLVSDGGDSAEFGRPQEDFAKDIVRKVMTILKTVETSNDSKQAALITIKGLLEETTNYGDTPLHFALRHEQFGAVKYILMILGSDPLLKSIVNLQNSMLKTPLHLAVLQNQPEIVRALLKLGADPNICDEEDATSLHNAVIVNARECIEELLHSNVKLNLEAHTEAGWSALHLAAKAGSLYAVKALIAAGANVNSTDMSYGRTVLHVAVDGNHKHIANYLLTKTEIDVNLKNFGGNTALHGAVVKGGKYAEKLIVMLKKHGADPKIRNNNVHEEDEEDESFTPPPTQLTTDSLIVPTIKSESSDSEDESEPGESSFDLAKNDPKLMKLLRDERPVIPTEEELHLKEESEDEMPLQDRQEMLQAQCRTSSSGRSSISSNQEPSKQKPSPNASKTLPTSNFTPQQQELIRQGDEKLSDEHVKGIVEILNRTGGWERLAQHTNHGSLVRLYKKLSSPSSALFVKIRLQNPDITVRQVKKLLIEVQAFEAAAELEKR